MKLGWQEGEREEDPERNTFAMPNGTLGERSGVGKNVWRR
jgi:hypothetical protein